MTQQVTGRLWQAEAGTEEAKQFIRDIKRITRRKFTAEEKIHIVLEGFRRDTPIRDLYRFTRSEADVRAYFQTCRALGDTKSRGASIRSLSGQFVVL